MEAAPSRAFAAEPKEAWRQAVEAVRAASSRHGKSLAFGRLVALRPGEVALSFSRDSVFHRAQVMGGGRAIVEKALSDHFGQPTRLVEEEGGSEGPSLAEEEAKGRAARERALLAKVRAHPAVCSTLRILGGEIEHLQILEEERPEKADPES